MTKRVKHLNIDVTRRDIAAGRRRHCAKCPIALALKRRTHARAVYVDFEVAMVTDPVDGPAFAISGDLEVFMNAFDAGRPVRPFRPCLEAKG